MKVTNISDAKATLSRLIERVQQGEEVIIGKAGRPIAKLVPYEVDTRPRNLDGIWQDQVRIADDFDELPEEILRVFMGDDEPAA
jgi:prevent-host-death family protein